MKTASPDHCDAVCEQTALLPSYFTSSTNPETALSSLAEQVADEDARE
ncbi:MAG: hypothetical protein H7330_06915 [Hymenobacteraceae bacterium]|nr:hypothetical protein [Hymenobacteraceae bacterium]